MIIYASTMSSVEHAKDYKNEFRSVSEGIQFLSDLLHLKNLIHRLSQSIAFELTRVSVTIVECQNYSWWVLDVFRYFSFPAFSKSYERALGRFLVHLVLDNIQLYFLCLYGLAICLPKMIMNQNHLYNDAAMLAYKTVSGTKSFKKLVHLTLQFIAFCLSIIGVWAALKFHNDKGIDNFYSLHSWLGLACLFFFTLQVPSQLLFLIPFWPQKIASIYNYFYLVFTPIFFCTVGCWFCIVLVPRRLKNQQSYLTAMACVCWYLYLRPCCCYCNYWYFRKSHIPSNQPHNLTLFN